MEFSTHAPTGRPSWPLILLSGIQGGGKSWTAAEASALPMFGRTFWLEIGERTADEYGAVPGARYEIIDHDGSWRQIMGAAEWAGQQPTIDGKPNLLVLDSMTNVWALLKDEAQVNANRRAERKGRRVADMDVDITMDLWNQAKDSMSDLLNVARRFPGPVLLTARLDETTVVVDGAPTRDKVWKVQAEKNLPYEVTVVMQARAPRQWTMTKISNAKLEMPAKGYEDWPHFSIEELMIRMELDSATVAPSTYVRLNPSAARDDDSTGDAPQEQGTGEALEKLPYADRAQLDAYTKGLEDNLDADALLHAWKVAKSHEHRIAMAVIGNAGKRVKAALERIEAEREAQDAAAETPQEGASEPETAPQDAPADEAPQSDPEPEKPVQAPEAPDAEPTPQETPDAEPELTPQQISDKAAGVTPETEPQETLDGPAHDGQIWNDETKQWEEPPAPDPENTRRAGKRRDGALRVLVEQWGDAMPDEVFARYGLDVEHVSTTRLEQLIAKQAASA